VVGSALVAMADRRQDPLALVEELLRACR